MVNARKSSLTGIYDTLSVSGYATELKGVLCGPSSVDRYVDIHIDIHIGIYSSMTGTNKICVFCLTESE